MEIAKLRAARYLWAKKVKQLFNPQNEKSLILRRIVRLLEYL